MNFMDAYCLIQMLIFLYILSVLSSIKMLHRCSGLNMLNPTESIRTVYTHLTWYVHVFEVFFEWH